MSTLADDFWYMASPYRKHPLGLDGACEAAARCAAALIERGVNVYSPIVHSHKIAQYVSTFDARDDRWLQVEIPYMRRSKGMIVMKLATWDLSSGIKFERDWFTAHRRPIFILDDPLPDELPGGLRT